MTTEAELGQQAVDLAQQTSYTWDQYLSRIRSDPSYAYKKTKWYDAGGKLEASKHLSGGGGNPTPPPSDDLTSVRGRIFLADHPMDCVTHGAPHWMVPVCTADAAYASWYTHDVIDQLRSYFGAVETWADCRNPTAYNAAVAMSDQFGLDGAWGQCETTGELEAGYNEGARRFVGNIDPNVMNEDWLNKVKTQEILLTVELYRNKMPWMLPDWRNANQGIGGNCIACYASSTEGAYYTPVQAYKDQGLYVPKHDSVYGVGLHAEDWPNLA